MLTINKAKLKRRGTQSRAHAHTHIFFFFYHCSSEAVSILCDRLLFHFYLIHFLGWVPLLYSRYNIQLSHQTYFPVLDHWLSYTKLLGMTEGFLILVERPLPGSLIHFLA